MTNRYKSVAAIRDDAKGFMNGNYARAVGIVLIFFGIYYVVSMILSAFDQILTAIFVNSGMVSDGAVLVMDIIYGIISLVLNILLAIFTIGMSLFYLKIGCKAQAAAIDLFAGFREDFSRSLQIACRVNGSIGLAMLPGSVLLSYYIGTKQMYALYAAVISILIGGILAIYISLTYEMSYFIMHDFSDYSSGEVISACRKKMKGHKWRLLGLELSFIPYYILAILTLGIGMLWVYPLVREAQAQFYLDLMNPKKVSGEWERTV